MLCIIREATENSNMFQPAPWPNKGNRVSSRLSSFLKLRFGRRGFITWLCVRLGAEKKCTENEIKSPGGRRQSQRKRPNGMRQPRRQNETRRGPRTQERGPRTENVMQSRSQKGESPQKSEFAKNAEYPLQGPRQPFGSNWIFTDNNGLTLY